MWNFGFKMVGDNWVHISQICDEIFGKVHKVLGNGEERYICPFHDDTNPSLDVNKEKGVYVCRACGKAGSLYDLAKEYNYPKPHLYIPNNNGYVDQPSVVHIPNPPVVTPSIIETIQHSQKYLNEHLNLIPSNWNADVVKELGIGRHQNQWLYPYYDDSQAVGYKLDKIKQEPKGIKCRVFPSMDIVKKYDGKCSEVYIEKFCNYIGISQKEFWSVVEKFRGPMWKKDEKGNWHNTYLDLLK